VKKRSKRYKAIIWSLLLILIGFFSFKIFMGFKQLPNLFGGLTVMEISYNVFILIIILAITFFWYLDNKFNQ
jgi:hypothetical protein